MQRTRLSASLTPMAKKMELWGIEDVADALGITVNAAYQRKYRGAIPEPEWIVSGRPIWSAAKMRRWIERQS